MLDCLFFVLEIGYSLYQKPRCQSLPETSLGQKTDHWPLQIVEFCRTIRFGVCQACVFYQLVSQKKFRKNGSPGFAHGGRAATEANKKDLDKNNYIIHIKALQRRELPTSRSKTTL